MKKIFIFLIIIQLSNSFLLIDKFIYNNNKIPNIYKHIVKKIDCNETEIKHGRLAMLGTVGYISSETLHPVLANKYYLDNLLTNKGLAPSILNGGLDKINTKFYIFSIIISILFEFIYSIELLSFDNQRIDNYTFDPLNIYNNKSIEDKNKIKNIEKNIGRYAMIGITYIFYNEYISQIPIVQTSSYLSIYVNLFIYIHLFA